MKKLSLILASTLVGLSAAHAEVDGAQVYATCAACHQPTGAGIPNVFPPLAESEWVNGPAENLIRIQLRGLSGEITVKGTTYNSVMPANANLSDEEIAAVLTHIRSNFGNNAPAVTADQVAALRSEVGQPALTAKDLIDPTAAPAAPAEKPAEAAKPAAQPAPEAQATPAAPAAPTPAIAAQAPVTGKVTKSEPKAKANKVVLAGISAWTLICLLPVVTGFGRKA